MNKEDKNKILDEYQRVFDLIEKLYASYILPEGMAKVSDIVTIISNNLGYEYNDVKNTIEELKNRDDEERIILNEERLKAYEARFKEYPNIDISQKGVLENLEKTNEGLNMMLNGESLISGETFEDLSKQFQDLISKIDSEDFMPEFNEMIAGNDSFSGVDNNDKSDSKTSDKSSSGSGHQRVIVDRRRGPSKKRAIDEYGENLNELAKEGKIDTIIGRESEIERTIEILNRRSKNNPCLIGEPGVGKTAIAQGLALKIVSGEVPYKLRDKQIYLLDMATLIAGTQFRGQFEARVKAVINDCKKDGNIILVIDEIHTIVGVGDADNSTNAANILKPALSNGVVQLIGTTTLDEYRKYIEKDSALERRFQPVIVEEPSESEAIEIIDGIKKYYEDYHKVKISKNIVEQVVKLSEKYIHNRFLPDKALDLIDESCSRINLKNLKLHKLEKLKSELKEVEAEKEEAIQSDSTEAYKKAAECKQKECALKEQIAEIEKEIKPVPLTLEDIAKVIEKWTGVPVAKITQEEAKKLLTLEKNIHERVVGQDSAVKAVSKAIRRNRAGLQTTKRPPSFLFVGPTGVGKTELAKAVAVEMFGSEKDIIRLDMSEYMEKYQASKLIGAAPGYVGYDEAGQLTEKVRRNPYSIILLDEVEKAHPDVFNIFLQVLDDGRLTDSQGRLINFENTIIIMTSNAGSHLNTNSIGFGESRVMQRDRIMSAVQDTFRPEFLNRIDEIIVFDSLDENALMNIINIFVSRLQKVLESRLITVELDEKSKKYVISKGTNLKYGARPLRRAMQKLVEDEITEMILYGKVKEGSKILVTVDDDNKSIDIKNKENLETLGIDNSENDLKFIVKND